MFNERVRTSKEIRGDTIFWVRHATRDWQMSPGPLDSIRCCIEPRVFELRVLRRHAAPNGVSHYRGVRVFELLHSRQSSRAPNNESRAPGGAA